MTNEKCNLLNLFFFGSLFQVDITDECDDIVYLQSANRNWLIWCTVCVLDIIKKQKNKKIKKKSPVHTYTWFQHINN